MKFLRSVIKWIRGWYRYIRDIPKTRRQRVSMRKGIEALRTRGGPEAKELAGHLEASDVLDFHVSWGPKTFTEFTAEQRCAELNKLYRALAAGHSKSLDFGDSHANHS